MENFTPQSTLDKKIIKNKTQQKIEAHIQVFNMYPDIINSSSEIRLQRSNDDDDEDEDKNYRNNSDGDSNSKQKRRSKQQNQNSRDSSCIGMLTNKNSSNLNSIREDEEEGGGRVESLGMTPILYTQANQPTSSSTQSQATEETTEETTQEEFNKTSSYPNNSTNSLQSQIAPILHHFDSEFQKLQNENTLLKNQIKSLQSEHIHQIQNLQQKLKSSQDKKQMMKNRLKEYERRIKAWALTQRQQLLDQRNILFPNGSDASMTAGMSVMGSTVSSGEITPNMNNTTSQRKDVRSIVAEATRSVARQKQRRKSREMNQQKQQSQFSTHRTNLNEEDEKERFGGPPQDQKNNDKHPAALNQYHHNNHKKRKIQNVISEEKKEGEREKQPLLQHQFSVPTTITTTTKVKKSISNNNTSPSSPRSTFPQQQQQQQTSTTSATNKSKQSIPATNTTATTVKRKPTIPNPYANTKYCQPISTSTSTSNDEKEPSYRYNQVTRNKSERRSMPGRVCPDCKQFFTVVLGKDEDPKKFIHDCSRHRSRYSPELTPEGFWELSFADSIKNRQNNIKINQKEKEMGLKL